MGPTEIWEQESWEARQGGERFPRREREVVVSGGAFSLVSTFFVRHRKVEFHPHRSRKGKVRPKTPKVLRTAATGKGAVPESMLPQQML